MLTKKKPTNQKPKRFLWPGRGPSYLWFGDLITKDNMVQMPSVASITIVLAKRKKTTYCDSQSKSLLLTGKVGQVKRKNQVLSFSKLFFLSLSKLLSFLNYELESGNQTQKSYEDNFWRQKELYWNISLCIASFFICCKEKSRYTWKEHWF